MKELKKEGWGGAVDTEEIRPGVAIYARIIGYAIHWESDVICKRSEEMEGGQSIKKKDSIEVARHLIYLSIIYNRLQLKSEGYANFFERKTTNTPKN